MKILKLLKFIILISIPFGIVGILHLENQIGEPFNERMQRFLFEEIENTEPLPRSFINTIEKYYPNKFKQGVWSSIFNQMIGNPRNQCQCREIYFPQGYAHRWFAAEMLAFEIEDRFSPKQCYAYIMKTGYFGLGAKGIRDAAQQFYNKDVEALTEKEIIELNVRLINPSLYRNEEKLSEKVREIMLK